MITEKMIEDAIGMLMYIDSKIDEVIEPTPHHLTVDAVDSWKWGVSYYRGALNTVQVGSLMTITNANIINAIHFMYSKFRNIEKDKKFNPKVKFDRSIFDKGLEN